MNDYLEVIGKIIKSVKNYDKIPDVWVHGNDLWKWSKDFNCYIQNKFNQMPTEFCLGDRYVHLDYGLDSKCIFRGSTSDDWHGYDFGYDLKSAIEWVQNANYKDLEWYLWSGLK